MDVLEMDTSVHDCYCSLYAWLNINQAVEDALFIAKRQSKYEDMQDDILYQIDSKWEINHGYMIHRNMPAGVVQARMRILADRPINQIRIQPLFKHGSFPRSDEMHYNVALMNAYRSYDKYTMGLAKGEGLKIWSSVRNSTRQVFGGLASPVPGYEKHYKVSVFNLAYGHVNGMPNVWYTPENLYPVKISKLIEKYSKATHELNSFARDLVLQWPQVLKMLNELYLKTSGSANGYIFSVDRSDIAKACGPMGSSPGIRPGPTYFVDSGLFRYLFTVNGKKYDQEHWACIQIEEMIDAIKRGQKKVLHPAPVAKLTLKQEALPIDAGTEEERELDRIAKRDKAREYFIMHLVDYKMGFLLLNFRQNLERGSVIRIGHKWDFGGAQKMADYFRYTDKKNALFH